MSSFGVHSREPEAGFGEYAPAKMSASASGPMVLGGGQGGRWRLATYGLGALSAVLLIALIISASGGGGSEGGADAGGGGGEPSPSPSPSPSAFSQLSPGGGFCSPDAVALDAAAAPPCSNGTFYFDRGAGGVAVCECYQGYVGKSCDVKVGEDTVVVSAKSNAPTANMLTEPYWRESETLGDGMSGLVSMVSSYRIGYNWGSEGAGWSLMSDIESKIRELHAKVGNAKTEGATIVIGLTVDQLIQAAVYAMARRDPSGEEFYAVTGGTGPVYPLYWRDMVDFYRARHFRWVDGADADSYSGPGAIELIVSPNAKAAAAQAAPTFSADARAVVDRSKYWPQFTRTTEEINARDDAIIFSLCEATGHCGTRFAWAVVSDPQLARGMMRFVGEINMHTPRDVQLRVSTVLEIVLARAGTDACMFRAARATMAARWARLEAAFAAAPAAEVTLLDRPAGATPALATLQCGLEGTAFSPSEEEMAALVDSAYLPPAAGALPTKGCGAFLLHRAGVLAHDNADTNCAKNDFSHVFLDLTMRDADFDLLMSRLAVVLAETS